MQPVMGLLAAPKIAGLLMAPSASVPAFTFTDPRLASLPNSTHQGLTEACQQLFTLALDCLMSDEGRQPALNVACLRFASDIERLTHSHAGPASPSRQPLRFRSRAEMDAELQGIVERMREHFSQPSSRHIVVEARGD